MPKTTGQTCPSDRSDRSPQNRGAAHSARKCATRRLPSLLVSIHHPTASRRINLTQQGQKSTSRCPEIKIGGNKPWATNTPQDLPDQWVYLAHIPRHARYLAGGLFCRKATKVIPYFQLLAPYSICLNRQLVFASSKQPYQILNIKSR